MKEVIDASKVFLAVVRLKQNMQVESIAELESKGLEEVCSENGVDYDDLTESEKETIRYEIIRIVEEIEFCNEYRELYLKD